MKLLQAIIIVIIITLIAYIVYRLSRDHRTTIEAGIQGSAGVLDRAARAALNEIRDRPHLDPPDRFFRAYIIDNNVNEHRGPPEPQVVEDYEAVMHAIVYQGGLDFGMFADDFIVQHIMNRVPFTPLTATAQAQSVENRLAAATQEAETKAEFAEAYLDRSMTHTSDPQNVHDSAVNAKLQVTLERLRVDPAGKKKSIAEAREFIGRYDATKAGNAMRTLDKIENGAYIDTFRDHEDNIFHYVWNRTNDLRNEKNASLMREAVVDALNDSVEKDSLVCIGGRCSRILSSLVTLDFDPSIGAAMTYESYKNQIFSETNQIINEAIDSASKSDRENMRNVARSFREPLGGVEVEPDVEAEFVRGVKQSIDDNMSKYIGSLKPDEISKLRDECYAAII